MFPAQRLNARREITGVSAHFAVGEVQALKLLEPARTTSYHCMSTQFRPQQPPDRSFNADHACQMACLQEHTRVLVLQHGLLCRLVNRELVPWMPDDDGKSLEGLTLNSTQAGKLGRWDQFAANKAQFGVQTTFDEDVSF